MSFRRGSRKAGQAGPVFDVNAVDAADESDDVLGPPVQTRRWRVMALAAAGLLAVGGLAGYRLLTANSNPPRHPAAPSTTARSSSTPVAAYGATSNGIGNVLGDRCPSGVTCGVADQIRGGMDRTFQTYFPWAHITSRASAFDAGNGEIYWQQVVGQRAGGGSATATVQRTKTVASSHAPLVDATSDEQFITVIAKRGVWRVSVTLIGEQAHRRGEVAAAKSWVSAVRLPT